MVAFAENKIRRGTRGFCADAETQNYYVRNRYYLPTLGRWLTRDPIGYQGGINLYEYVQSSPVANVDPEGEAGAFEQYQYWRAQTQKLVALFPDFQGRDLTLLKGIAAASMLKELQAERRYAGSHNGMDPMEYLKHLIAQLSKEKHAFRCKPGGDAPLEKFEKALDKAKQIANDIENGLELKNGNGPQQIAALGNLLGQLASHLPPGFRQLVGFYGNALSSAAGAVGQLDKAEGAKAWSELEGTTTNQMIPIVGGSDIPFSPGWANRILNQFGDSVPGFSQAYQYHLANRY